MEGLILVRCAEFYNKWQKYGNFCEKDPNTAAQIEAYLDQILEIAEVIEKIPGFVKEGEDPTAIAASLVSEGATRPLISEKDREIRQEAIEQIAKKSKQKKSEGKEKKVTGREVEEIVDETRRRLGRPVENIWDVVQRTAEKKSKFNLTSDAIEWARYTWNPVTGCLGPDGKGVCSYCYARDISMRFYHTFDPTFIPERLHAPQNTKVPPNAVDEPGYKNVFVCSMADLFGDWVDKTWIERVMLAVTEAPQWTFIFLTKNPKRLLDITWPENAWVGTTVDVQARVEKACEVFRDLEAPVKFLSCEPLLEPLEFNDLSMFDWMIIGGQSEGNSSPAFQPEWMWVESLLIQARKFGLKVYFKPNLESRPKEFPT